MKIKLHELTTDRKWRAATGLDKKRFYNLLPVFEDSYLAVNGKSIAYKQEEMQTEFAIQSEAELLYFTLFSLKSGLNYDLLGLVSGMDGSNAKRNQATGIAVLNHAISKLGHMPRRNFMNKKDIEAFFSDIDTLIIDATEQKIQRPLDPEKQQEHYSGKKNTIR